MEQWKTITDFPNYEISNYGKCRRRTKGPHTQIGKVLKPRITTGGYIEYGLCKDKKIHFKLAHTLVLLQFVSLKPTEKHQCRHLDDDKKNNHHWNLQWGTSWENYKDYEDKYGSKLPIKRKQQ